jgi:hypothetical protein
VSFKEHNLECVILFIVAGQAAQRSHTPATYVLLRTLQGVYNVLTGLLDFKLVMCFTILAEIVFLSLDPVIDLKYRSRLCDQPVVFCLCVTLYFPYIFFLSPSLVLLVVAFLAGVTSLRWGSQSR